MPSRNPPAWLARSNHTAAGPAAEPGYRSAQSRRPGTHGRLEGAWGRWRAVPHRGFKSPPIRQHPDLPLSTRDGRTMCRLCRIDLSLRGPVAPQQCRDLRVVTSAVQFRDEIVGLNLVLIAPPPASLVVPDSPPARHPAGDIPASAHRGTCSSESAAWTGDTDSMPVACRAGSSPATRICSNAVPW
jgi:hypothetical protein